MAEDLMDYVRTHPAKGFTPKPYYSTVGDCIIYYATNEDCYARRLNSLLTVFLSMETNKVIGCKVKGVKRVILPRYRSFLMHGQTISSLALAGMAACEEVFDENASEDYVEQMGEITNEVPFDPSEYDLEACGA